MWLEGFADLLPRHTVVGLRKMLGGVDRLNFKE